MSLRPLLSLLVKTLHIGLELGAVDAPYAPSSDLDGRELSRPDQGVDLGHADGQVSRHIFQSEEPGLDVGSAVAGAGVGLGHLVTIAPDRLGYLHLASFAAVCCEWTPARGGTSCR